MTGAGNLSLEPADEHVGEPHPEVVCHLDQLLHAQGMTLVGLSELVGVSVVNLSVLKNNRAKAIRFTTLVAICAALDCSVGELLSVSAHPPPNSADGGPF